MYLVYMLFSIIALVIVLLIWGKWRYDIVAMMALLLATVTGVVPYQHMFAGFSHAAVITVACIMVISYSITQSGILQSWVMLIKRYTHHPSVHIGLFCSLAAVISAFINNVGALMLMMPSAIATALAQQRSPSLILMPLAFASVLGGLTTAIGTPPNIIIAMFRAEAMGSPFTFFDFTPVGLAVALVGVIFLSFFGWRLLPRRQSRKSEQAPLLQIDDYLAEIRVYQDSPWIGQMVAAIEQQFQENLLIWGIIRHKRKRLANIKMEEIKVRDVILIEADSDTLKKLTALKGLEIIGGKPYTQHALSLKSMGVIEAVVPQGSRVENRSANSMKLRTRYQINLLGLSRQGQSISQRLQERRFKPGDVVLLQGLQADLLEQAMSLGFLPLLEYPVTVLGSFKKFLPLGLLLAAIGLHMATPLPMYATLALAVLGLILCESISIREFYESIDWSILVLLGALLPLGNALIYTGGHAWLAQYVLGFSQIFAPWGVLILIAVLTMTLSDVMNNAVTAVIMAPLAMQIATQLAVNPDTFLMTVAVSASCSFLTPISHQNNTLVLGPGGYHFMDYVKLGLPLELLVLLTAIPIILVVWPL